MGRWIAVVAALAVAVAGVPAAAGAAAVDPVRAVKQAIRPGHGVRLTEVIRYEDGSKRRLKATVEFDKNQPVAATIWRGLSTDVRRDEGDLGPHGDEEILTDGVAYLSFSQAVYIVDGKARDLPPGKMWLSIPWFDVNTRLSSQRIDVFQPAVLAAALKGATRERVAGGFLFRGTVTYAQLLKAYRITEIRVFDPLRSRKAQISWRLWVDSRGYPQRLISIEKSGTGKSAKARWIDTRYTDWGIPVSITAPPADQVVALGDEGSALPGSPTA